MRRLLILGLLVLSAQTATAQMAGVKGGLVSSKFSGNTVTPEGRLTAFGGGAFVQLSRGSLGLQLELMAMTKGAKVTDLNADDSIAKIKINYAEVPVNALLRLPGGPYVFGGPALAIETGCQLQIKQNDLKIDSNCEGQGVFDRHWYEVSGLVGAGVQHSFFKRAFFLEARQEFGLTNIAKQGEVKNRAFAVFIGYGTGMVRGH